MGINPAPAPVVPNLFLTQSAGPTRKRTRPGARVPGSKAYNDKLKACLNDIGKEQAMADIQRWIVERLPVA